MERAELEGSEILKFVLNHRDERTWNEWEQAFLDKIEWLGYEHLTRKQKSFLDVLHEKLIGEER